jgi:hypothetical protein
MVGSIFSVYIENGNEPHRGTSDIVLFCDICFSEETGEGMESSVAALLLVTSTVVLSCIVVVYAVDTVQQSFSGQSPQMQLINSIQERILNQTSLFNGTLPEMPYATTNPEQTLP